MTKTRVHLPHERPSVGFNKGHRFGKIAQSPCPFSYWATPECQRDPDLFYRIVQIRSLETKGREKVKEL